MHMVWILPLIALVVVLGALALDLRLIRRMYTVQSGKLSAPVRFVLLSDLHAEMHGQEQARLMEHINAAAPDFVLLAGDITDERRKMDSVKSLFSALSNHRVYYGFGNHEYNQDLDPTRQLAQEFGVNLLENQRSTITVHGQTIHITGITDPRWRDRGNPDYCHEQTARQLGKQAQNHDGLHTLIAHRPELFPLYLDFDIIVSGHAHGGQFRIPGLVNGLLAPGQGLFPRYAGGVYHHNQDGKSAVHVVSRGLARLLTSSRPLPRLFNRPEVVVVDILPVSPVSNE